MSEANALLKSYIDRILNVLEEIDALGEGKKRIYKDLADDGFDRSVVSQVVGHLRKKARKPAKFEEQAQLFDLYLFAYEDDGTDIANAPAARETVDPDTGEILESDEQFSAGVQIMRDRAADHAPSGQLEIISPATATQSTDASQERAQTATGVGTGGDNLAPASRPSASAKTGIPDHQSQIPGEGQSQHDSGVRVASVDTTSAARLKTTDEVADDMGLPAEAHPGCRKPKVCGRFSHKGLCAICRGEDREAA